jgi:hypothetical protein
MLLCVSSCQAEQSTAATLRQQLGAQEAQFAEAQQQLTAARQELERKTKLNNVLQQTKSKLWGALTAGPASASGKTSKGDTITTAIQQQARNMARLQALEASSAVRHFSCAFHLRGCISLSPTTPSTCTHIVLDQTIANITQQPLVSCCHRLC